MVLIALADSDAGFRDTLGQLVLSEPDFRMLPGACLLQDAPAEVERERPDIMLLSVSRDFALTIPILERINATRSPTKTVLLVEHENQDFFVRAVRAGCRGIVPKDTQPDLLLKCIAKVHEGELWLDRATTAQVLRQFTEEQPSRQRERDNKSSPLSPREREIVGLVIQGLKNKELADKLAISEQTVKNHMHNIFDKLGVSDRLELALYAIHNRLLDSL